jgi:sulfate transporter 3
MLSTSSCLFLQIGHLKKGLNPLSVSELSFGSPFLMAAMKTGIITGIIGLAVSPPASLAIYLIPCMHIHFL